MGLRRKSRELALQFLYGHDLQQQSGQPEEVAAAIERFLACLQESKSKVPEKALPYAKDLIQGICSDLEAIDRSLRSYSHNWRLERMSLIDRNILRIAAYEMRCTEDVPPQVAINEALEIAKNYSTNDSISFINGILDAMSKGEKSST